MGVPSYLAGGRVLCGSDIPPLAPVVKIVTLPPQPCLRAADTEGVQQALQRYGAEVAMRERMLGPFHVQTELALKHLVLLHRQFDNEHLDASLRKLVEIAVGTDGEGSHKHTWPVLRLFPPCALISHAQGSSGVVDNMPFAWRGHTKSLATRARPRPDLAVWLE